MNIAVMIFDKGHTGKLLHLFDVW